MHALGRSVCQRALGLYHRSTLAPRPNSIQLIPLLSKGTLCPTPSAFCVTLRACQGRLVCLLALLALLLLRGCLPRLPIPGHVLALILGRPPLLRLRHLPDDGGRSFGSRLLSPMVSSWLFPFWLWVRRGGALRLAGQGGFLVTCRLPWFAVLRSSPDRCYAPRLSRVASWTNWP